jgi:hypothetical protein
MVNLDIQVITAPTVRLDLDADRRNLAETVARLRPRLLILDPFVRLHRIDENASGEVAPLLAYLRELQRRHDVAVLVVHHAKKGGGGVRAGQALRGSSEFHAWGDSNLYLRRDGDDLSLSVEHRAAPSMTPIAIELAHSLVPTPHCRSPSCVPAVASAPPRSISGSPCSLTPAASSKPTTDIASPTADPGTSDNHNKAANAPASQFPFPGSLQVRERESGSACGRRLSRATGRSQSNTFSGSAPRSILPSRPLDLDAVARSGSQDRPASGPPKAWS